MKPLSPKAIKFFTNISIWSICCALILGYNSIVNKTEIISKISLEDKASLTKLIDTSLMGALLVSCLIAFCIASFIGFRWGAPNSQERMNALYNQIVSELSSVILNAGSLFYAVAYFTGTLNYYIGSFVAFLLWYFIEPKQS